MRHLLILLAVVLGIVEVCAFPDYYRHVRVANGGLQNVDTLRQRRGEEEVFDKLINDLESIYGKLQSFQEEGTDTVVQNVASLPPNYTNTTTEIVKMGDLSVQKNTTVVKVTVNNSTGVAVFTSTNLLGGDGDQLKELNPADDIDNFFIEDDSDSSSSFEEFLSSSSDWMDEKADCVDDTDCAEHEFCDNMGFWFWPNECSGCMGEDEICNRDAECCPGSLCVLGRCHADVIPGDSGTFCDEDFDCLENNCCAYEPGLQATVCKSRGEEGMICSSGRDSFFNNIINVAASDCPCMTGLECLSLSTAYFSDTVCKRVANMGASNLIGEYEVIKEENAGNNDVITFPIEEQQGGLPNNEIENHLEQDLDYMDDASSKSSWEGDSWEKDEEVDGDSYIQLKELSQEEAKSGEEFLEKLGDIEDEEDIDEIEDLDNEKYLEEELEQLKEQEENNYKPLFDNYLQTGEDLADKVISSFIDEVKEDTYVMPEQVPYDPYHETIVNSAPNTENQFEDRLAVQVPIVEEVHENQFHTDASANQVNQVPNDPYQQTMSNPGVFNGNQIEGYQDTVISVEQVNQVPYNTYKQTISNSGELNGNQFETYRETVINEEQVNQVPLEQYQHTVANSEELRENQFEGYRETVVNEEQINQVPLEQYQHTVANSEELSKNQFEGYRETVINAEQVNQLPYDGYQQPIGNSVELESPQRDEVQSQETASNIEQVNQAPYQQVVMNSGELIKPQVEGYQETATTGGQINNVPYQQIVALSGEPGETQFEDIHYTNDVVPSLDEIITNEVEGYRESAASADQMNQLPYDPNQNPLVNSGETTELKFEGYHEVNAQSASLSQVNTNQFEGYQDTGAANQIPSDPYRQPLVDSGELPETQGFQDAQIPNVNEANVDQFEGFQGTAHQFNEIRYYPNQDELNQNQLEGLNEGNIDPMIANQFEGIQVQPYHENVESGEVDGNQLTGAQDIADTAGQINEAPYVPYQQAVVNDGLPNANQLAGSQDTYQTIEKTYDSYQQNVDDAPQIVDNYENNDKLGDLEGIDVNFNEIGDDFDEMDSVFDELDNDFDEIDDMFDELGDFEKLDDNLEDAFADGNHYPVVQAVDGLLDNQFDTLSNEEGAAFNPGYDVSQDITSKEGGVIDNAFTNFGEGQLLDVHQTMDGENEGETYDVNTPYRNEDDFVEVADMPYGNEGEDFDDVKDENLDDDKDIEEQFPPDNGYGYYDLQNTNNNNVNDDETYIYQGTHREEINNDDNDHTEYNEEQELDNEIFM